MRALTWLLVILAAIAGALYAVGYFVLPNTLEVTRSITIERPRATVFAQINDLRTSRQWSPLNARDPAAQYTFSSDPGEGQTMSWNGDDRRVRDGQITIVRSDPPTSVQTLLRFERETFDGEMTLERRDRESGHLTQVSWKVSSGCAQGVINVPCRYMNLFLRHAIEQDLDDGLSRLKNLTESLIDVDFEGLAPEFDTLPPKPFLYIPVTVSLAQISGDEPQRARVAAQRVAAAMRQGRLRAEDALMTNQLVRDGPLLRVLTQSDEERIAFRVGYAFSGPTPLTLTGEEIGDTPSGRVMRVLHVGPSDSLRDTYARAFAYLNAHHIELRGAGLPWEVVLRDADTPDGEVRVEIYYPIQ
jgi:uncharacterized protein YndB with AHSA1/START domain